MVYVDVTCYLQTEFISGIQRVVREVMRRLDKKSALQIIYLRYDQQSKKFKRTSLEKNGEKSEVLEFDALSESDVFFEIDACWNVAPKRSILYEKLKEKKVQIVTYIQDILPITHPEYFGKLGNWQFLGYIVACINYADRIVVTTEATRKSFYELLEKIDCKDINIDVIGLGVDLDEKLPKPRLVDEIIGFVTEEAAKVTGLMEGVPVIAGCSDAMASMHATGMSRLGEAGESSGTTSLVFVGSDVKSAPDIPVVTKPCTIDGMPWIFDAPIQTSGAALKWFIEKMAAEEVTYAKEHDLNIYTYLNELALESKPGAGGLFFFPYLLGERAPLWNEYARGMFIGMGMDMKRSDLVRAVFEGTAFALRHVMETVKEAGATAEVLRICGGGAKSRTWCQIKASMLNMPVYVMDDKSGDVPVGDALIVGHKLGVFPELTKAAEKIVKVNEIIEPVEEWVEAYDKLYPYYVEMYKHLDTDLKSLKNTVDQL